MEDYREPLFTGLTRAATLMGIPYNAFIILAGISGISFLWSQNIILPVITWLVGFAFIKMIIIKDEKAIDIFLSRLELLKPCHFENRQYWKTRSYSPE